MYCSGGKLEKSAWAVHIERRMWQAAAAASADVERLFHVRLMCDSVVNTVATDNNAWAVPECTLLLANLLSEAGMLH